MNDKYDIIVVGAGPAGLMAGISAAKNKSKVLILEQMPEAGRKLLICGKGRCNITNDCEITELIKNIPGNGKFLHSALRALDNQQIREFFHVNGLETKVERGGRVFPITDKAIDVRNLLLNIFSKNNGKVKLKTKVKQVLLNGKKVIGVKTDTNETFLADNVIIATGGASYPKTGSDGCGFKFAKACGHKVETLRPSLVPLESNFNYLRELQGLSLRNVTATIVVNGKKREKDFGEMLFTHFGLSGPIILTLSDFVSEYLSQDNTVEISIDLKPALTMEVLEARVQRDFAKFSKKQIKNSLGDLLPSSLIPVILDLAKIDKEKFTNQITKEERRNFVFLLKNFNLVITKTRPLAEAIVTAGGVNIKEINPKDMSSKLVEGLYFVGEVLDIHGYTGGFNLQAAFSTGFVAGTSAAKS